MTTTRRRMNRREPRREISHPFTAPLASPDRLETCEKLRQLQARLGRCDRRLELGPVRRPGERPLPDRGVEGDSLEAIQVLGTHRLDDVERDCPGVRVRFAGVKQQGAELVKGPGLAAGQGEHRECHAGHLDGRVHLPRAADVS